MIKKLMIAVALLAFAAVPAFASVQNVKIGGDLKTTSVIRNNFVSGSKVVGQDSQNVILSQIGLNVQADLTDNVSTTLRLNNERLWGTTPTNGAADTTTAVKLETAYVTMKEMLYAPLTVTVGRQPLAYGNQFLVGDGDLSNTLSDVSDLTGGVNFDAIKAVLAYDPLTVDLFAAKISETVVTSNDNDDANLFGINANYKVGDKMNSVVEAYTFVRSSRATPASVETKKLFVPGLRLSTNPIEGLNVQMEGAYQVGNTANNQNARAYGLQGMVNYALPVMKDMKPVLSAGYTYLSGDKNTGDGKNTAFDSLYENQNSGRIFDTLLTATNLKIASLALEVVPMQDITTKLSFYNLTLAEKGVTNSIKVGNELDLDVTYAYTEDVKFGVSAGIFAPGQYYAAEQQDNATQLLSSVQVAF